ncbi:MAG: peptidoglycan DD-metalloendopeptidase family protein, partial [Candidatus Nanopelagicales bacterium]
NILSFDFLDSSSKLKNSFEDLMTNVDDLGKGILDAFNIIIQPFTDIPPIGSDQLERERQQQEGRRQPQQPSAPSGGGSVGTKEQKSLLDAIAFAEGTRDQPNNGYKTLFGFGQFNDYSRHPDIVVRKNGYASAAAGRYQFMPATFNRLAKKLGLKDFSPESQDKAALELAKELGITQNILSNEGMSARVADKLGDQWASFPGSPFGQPTKSLQSIQKVYQKSLGAPSIQSQPRSGQKPTPAPTGQRRLQTGDIFTKSLGRGVDFIQITSLVGDGRGHGGIDVAAPYGTYISLKVDCEVVAQGEYGNYGLLIDVWVPSLGIQLRMAHLSSVIIKSGKIPAGTSFARVGTSGRVTGP